jgi:hypothetical protein
MALIKASFRAEWSEVGKLAQIAFGEDVSVAS